MASSSYNLIPYIIGTLKSIEFSSLLDVGTGFGKWGCLVREYCDFSKARSPADLQRGNWRIRIDGVEAFPQFIGDLHRYVYDNLYIGKAEEIIDSLGSYDVVVMVAVLAHFPEDVGLSFLRRLYQCATKALIVTIPTRHVPQGDIFENPYEVHHPVEWWHADFSFADHITTKDLPQGERILVMSRAESIPVANPYRARHSIARTIAKKLIGASNAKRLRQWFKLIE
jgi:hypothetical protein